MNLTTLTHRDALCLNARFTSREEAIHALTQRLAALGKISSTEQFLEEVYRRESLGPTALGEGLAVPHGKTAAVKEAAFAVATLSEPLQWEGVDGPEPRRSFDSTLRRSFRARNGVSGSGSRSNAHSTP